MPIKCNSIGFLSPPIKCNQQRKEELPWINNMARMSGIDINTAKWIEPFFGSGSVGFNVKLWGEHIAGDTNPHLIGFFNQIKDGTITPAIVKDYLENASLRMLESTSRGKDYYKMVKDRFNETHDPLDYMFLTHTAKLGRTRFSNDGTYNACFNGRSDKFTDRFIRRICNEVEIVKRRIDKGRWTFKVADYEDLINEYATEGDIVFCDPPLFGSMHDMYTGWGIERDTRLYEVLGKCPCRFMYHTWQRRADHENPMLMEMWMNYKMYLKEDSIKFGRSGHPKSQVVHAIFANF